MGLGAGAGVGDGGESEREEHSCQTFSPRQPDLHKLLAALFTKHLSHALPH